ncbi:hypothetical protein Tco_1177659 [Tanacetum coccineum]
MLIKSTVTLFTFIRYHTTLANSKYQFTFFSAAAVLYHWIFSIGSPKHHMAERLLLAIHEANRGFAKVGDDDVLFIGPSPPAIVNEAASANDADCFE